MPYVGLYLAEDGPLVLLSPSYPPQNLHHLQEVEVSLQTKSHEVSIVLVL